MNPQDLIAMAKEIYIHRVIFNPDWDKQKIARESIEAAKQFFLALQYEKEVIVYSSDAVPPLNPPQGYPTASTGTPPYQNQTIEHTADSRIGTGNQMAAGRGRVQQRQSGLGMD